MTGEKKKKMRGVEAQQKHPPKVRAPSWKNPGGTLPRKDGPLARPVPRSPASPPEQT